MNVIAHRGASSVEKGNTVAAFRRAGEMGADAVELDVRRTVDGVLVVHHDPIDAVPAAELPADVATLGEALDACAGMWVNVEIKDESADDMIAEETVAHLLARHTDERWLISSFRLATVDRCRQLAPQIRTAWLVERTPAGAVERLVERGHVGLHPWVDGLTRATVDACHAAGLEVNTWTCDDPGRIAELLDWGVDGVCTNVPDVALRVVAARG